jgi:hypothetical protein
MTAFITFVVVVWIVWWIISEITGPETPEEEYHRRRMRGEPIGTPKFRSPRGSRPWRADQWAH